MERSRVDTSHLQIAISLLSSLVSVAPAIRLEPIGSPVFRRVLCFDRQIVRLQLLVETQLQQGIVDRG